MFLQDVLKKFWRRLDDVLARRYEDVLKMSWRCVENALNLKTSSEDVWVRRIHSSWPRRLEDVFWRRRWKKSSRRLHQDECLLGWYVRFKYIFGTKVFHIAAGQSLWKSFIFFIKIWQFFRVFIQFERRKKQNLILKIFYLLA